MSEKIPKVNPQSVCFFCGRSARVLKARGIKIITSPLAQAQILANPIQKIIEIVMKETDINLTPNIENAIARHTRKAIVYMAPSFVCGECLQQILMALKSRSTPQQVKVPYEAKPIDDENLRDLTPEEARQIRDPDSDVNRMLSQIAIEHDMGDDTIAGGTG